MAVYRAQVRWTLESGGDFLKGRYSRGHEVAFSEQTLSATASAHVVGNRNARPGAVDPEELLVASISSCHMLSFLHVAREAGFIVRSYADAAEGIMAPNAQGRLAVTRVTLRPEIEYEGAEPDAARSDALHHAAHEACFIANSVLTEIVVEPPTVSATAQTDSTPPSGR